MTLDELRKKYNVNSGNTGVTSGGTTPTLIPAKSSTSSGAVTDLDSLRKKYSLSAENNRTSWDDFNDLDVAARNWTNYSQSGNYTSQDNRNYRTQLQNSINSVDTLMKKYTSSSSEYEKLQNYKTYFESGLSSLDRTDIGVKAIDYIKGGWWYDEPTRENQVAALKGSIDGITDEMNSIADKNSNEYKQLEAYRNWYVDLLNNGVMARNEYDAQFPTLEEYTYFKNSQDYTNTVKIQNNLEAAKNELADLESKKLTFGQKVVNYFTKEYDPNQAAEQERIDARIKELNQNIEAWQKDLDGMAKYQNAIIGNNYGYEYDPDKDYQKIVDELKVARDKASTPEEKAQITAQITYLAGENEDSGFLAQQKYLNTDVAALRERIAEIEEELKHANPHLPGGGEKRAELSAEYTRLSQEANLAERFQNVEGAKDIRNSDSYNRYIEEGKKHVEEGTDGRTFFTLPDEETKWYDEGNENAGKHYLDYALENLDYDELQDVYAYLGREWLGEGGDNYTPESVLDNLQETMNMRSGMKLAKELESIDNKALRWTAQTLGMGTLVGLDKFAGGASQFFSNDEQATSNIQYASGVNRENLAKYGDENILGTGANLSQLLYDATVTTSNMLPMIAFNYITGGVAAELGAATAVANKASQIAAGVSMGVSSAGSAYKQALSEGYTTAQARTFSTLVGTAEAGLQYLLGGISAMGGLGEDVILARTANINNAFLRYAAEMGVHIASETTEELLQNKLEPFLRNAIFSENNAISAWDADDTYTVLITALSTGLLESGNTVSTTLRAQNISNKIDKAAVGDKVKLASGYMISKTDSLRETLPTLALACDENSEAYKMAKEMESGKLKKTDMNFANLLIEYANTQASPEIASIKLQGAALKYNEINRLSENLKNAEDTTAAVKAANPGAEVLDKVQTGLKTKDGSLSLKELQKGAVIINKMSAGRDLSEAELTTLSGDTKLGKAMRAYLGQNGGTFSVGMKAAEVKAAVDKFIGDVRYAKMAQTQLKNAEIVKAAEDSASKAEVAAATEGAKIPTPQTAATESEIAKLHIAQENEEAIRANLNAVENANEIVMEHVGSSGVLAEAENRQSAVRLDKQIQNIDEQLVALREQKIPSKEQQTEIDNLTVMREDLQKQLSALNAVQVAEEAPAAEAPVDQSAQAQREAFEEMAGKGAIVAKSENSDIIDSDKVAKAKDLQRILSDAASNGEITKSASIKKINPLIEQIEKEGISDELFAKIQQVAESAANASQSTDLLRKLQAWRTSPAANVTEENVNGRQDTVAGEKRKRLKSGFADRGRWQYIFDGQREGSSHAVYSEQEQADGSLLRAVRYSNGKTVTASEDTGLYDPESRPDLKKLETLAKQAGVSNVYFTNKSFTADGGKARGWFIQYRDAEGKLRTDIWINANNRTVQPDRLFKHELFHSLLTNLDSEMRASHVQSMLNEILNEDELQELRAKYTEWVRKADKEAARKLWTEQGVNFTEEYLDEATSPDPDMIDEEIFADIAAGISAYGSNGGQYTGRMRSLLKRSAFIPDIMSLSAEPGKVREATKTLRSMLSREDNGLRQISDSWMESLNPDENNLDRRNYARDILYDVLGDRESDMLGVYFADISARNPNMNARDALLKAEEDLVADLFAGETNTGYEKKFRSMGFSFYDYVQKAYPYFNAELMGNNAGEHAEAIEKNTDSEGRVLGRNMAEYMAKSAIREDYKDLNSPLLVLYRAHANGVDLFELGKLGVTWWTDSRAISEVYRGIVGFDVYEGMDNAADRDEARKQADLTRLYEMFYHAADWKDSSFVFKILPEKDGGVRVEPRKMPEGTRPEKLTYASAQEAARAISANVPQNMRSAGGNLRKQDDGSYTFTLRTGVPGKDLRNKAYDAWQKQSRVTRDFVASRQTEWSGAADLTRVTEANERFFDESDDVADFAKSKSIARGYYRNKYAGRNVYRAYGMAKNPYVFDCEGKMWNQLVHPATGEITNTNEIVRYILNDPHLRVKYDGIIFENIRDNGGYLAQDTTSNTYVFFGSNQIKSIYNPNPTSDTRAAYSRDEDVNYNNVDDAGRPLQANALKEKDNLLRVGFKKTGPVMNLFNGTAYHGPREFDRSKISGGRPRDREMTMQLIREQFPDAPDQIGGGVFVTNDSFTAANYAGAWDLGANAVDSKVLADFRDANTRLREAEMRLEDAIDDMFDDEDLGEYGFDWTTRDFPVEGYMDLCFDYDLNPSDNEYWNARVAWSDAKREREVQASKLRLSLDMVKNSEESRPGDLPTTYDEAVAFYDSQNRTSSRISDNGGSVVKKISQAEFEREALPSLMRKVVKQSDNILNSFDFNEVFEDYGKLLRDPNSKLADLNKSVIELYDSLFDVAGYHFRRDTYTNYSALKNGIDVYFEKVMAFKEQMAKASELVVSRRENELYSRLIDVYADADEERSSPEALRAEWQDAEKVMDNPSNEVISYVRTIPMKDMYGDNSEPITATGYSAGEAGFIQDAQDIWNSTFDRGVYNFYLAPKNPRIVEIPAEELRHGAPSWNDLAEWVPEYQGFLRGQPAVTTRTSELWAELAEKYDSIFFSTIRDYGGDRGPIAREISPDRNGVLIGIVFDTNTIIPVEGRSMLSREDDRYEEYSPIEPQLPGFYSKMEREVDRILEKQKKVAPDNLLKQLKANGVKGAELKWSGLEVYLSDYKNQHPNDKFVNVDELKQFMLDNRIETERFVLSEGNRRQPEYTLKDQRGDSYSIEPVEPEDLREEFEANPSEIEFVSQLTGEIKTLQELFDLASVDGAEVRGYSEDPEVFTLVSPIGDHETYRYIYASDYYPEEGLVDETKYKQFPPNWGEYYHVKGSDYYQETGYRVVGYDHTNPHSRMHWNQNGLELAPGTFAHVRSADFGDIRLLEEVQSDWSNHGWRTNWATTREEMDAAIDAQTDRVNELEDKSAQMEEPARAARKLLKTEDPDERASRERQVEWAQERVNDIEKYIRWTYAFNTILSRIKDTNYAKVFSSKQNARQVLSAWDRWTYKTADQGKLYNMLKRFASENWQAHWNLAPAEFLLDTRKTLTESLSTARTELLDVQERLKEFNESGSKLTEEEKKEAEAVLKAHNDLQAKAATSRQDLHELIDEYDRAALVPEGPFTGKNNDAWMTFALRDQLMQAARDGMSYLAWTTGYQQSFRWRLRYYDDGMPFQEAYNNTYDKKITSFFKKFGAQFNVQPEDIEIKDLEWDSVDKRLRPQYGPGVTEPDKFVHAIPITEEMRNSILSEGFSMYSRDEDEEESIIPNDHVTEDVYETPAIPEEIVPNTYPQDSAEQIILSMLRGNDYDLNAVNTALNELYLQRLEEQEKNASLSPGPIIPKQFTPDMKPGEAEVIYNQLERLIGKFGALEQGYNSARNILMPKQQSETRNTRRVYRSAAESKGTADYMVPYIDRDVITSLAASYVPISNKNAMSKAVAAVGKDYAKANAEWDGIASESHFPTASDIALGELLFMQAAQEGQVNRAMKILADVAAMGTAAGQTVQAMAMIKKLTPAGQLYYLQQAVNRLNKKNEKLITSGKAQALTINQELAEAVFNAKTKEELDNALEAIKQDIASQMPVTLKDRWDAWRYLAMLGNFRTHGRNVFGNAIFMPTRLLKDTIASGLETAFIRDPYQRTKNLGAMLASSAGTAANLFTGRFAAGKQIDLNKYTKFANDDFDQMQSVVAQSGKYNMIDELQEKRQILRPKALDKLSRLNTNALEGEDAVFLKRAYVSAMAQFLAARNADVSALMDDSVESARLLNAARQYATLEAQKATYRDFSATASALNKLKKVPVIGTLLDGVLPFTKTPINILKRGVEYSPLGLMKAISVDMIRMAQGKITAAQAIDNIAAGMSGTMVAALGLLLAHLGIAKGAEDDDDKQSEFDALKGQQKYSLEIGNYSYTIDWMAPVSLPFFVGVELYKQVTNDGETELSPDALYQFAMSVAEPIMSLSMLDGLNTVLSADDYVEGPAKIATLATTAAGSYAGQGLPTIMGQLARTIDGTRHSTYVDKNSKIPADLQYFWQASVQSKIPGYLSQKMDYVDEWGRKDYGEESVLLRAVENFLSPGYLSQIYTTATDDELQRLADVTGDTSVLPTKAAKYFTANGVKKNLTAEEYEAMQIDRGQTSFSLMTKLINDRRYQRLTDAEKAKAVSYIYDYAGNVAKYHIDPTYNLHNQGVWMEEAEAMADPYERVWEKIEDYFESQKKKANK